jgi:hypothetical protein
MLSNVIETAMALLKIDDMKITFIGKPYKTFIVAAAKLCALFSFLVFLSFHPIIALFLAAVYLMLFYMTYIFIKFCAAFGYKKIMLTAVFGVLYFLCFVLVTNLRHFIASLYFA